MVPLPPPRPAQASAMHSISMSNSSRQEPAATKVRAGGLSGKWRA